MDSRMEEVCIPPVVPPPPPREEEADSNVITLPTLEAMWSSIFAALLLFANPLNPVIDDAALGISSLLFPPMGTNVAGGVLLVASAPKELSNEDMGSTRMFAAAAAATDEWLLSEGAVCAGGCGEMVVGGSFVDWALMDGTILFDS